MKKILKEIIFIICITSFCDTLAQISVTKTEVKKIFEKPIAYDGRLNITAIKDVKNKDIYYGLEGFFAPPEVFESNKVNRSITFLKNSPIFIKDTVSYRKYSKDGYYQGMKDTVHTKFDFRFYPKGANLGNRKFKILESIKPYDLMQTLLKKRDSLVKSKHKPVDGLYHYLNGYYSQSYFLKIKDIETNEVFFTSELGYNNIFLLSDYLEYLKKYIGHKMYVVSHSNYAICKNILNGNEINIPEKSIWTIEEVTFVPNETVKYQGVSSFISPFVLSFIISNEKLGKIAYRINSYKNPLYHDDTSRKRIKLIHKNTYKIQIEKNKLFKQKLEKERITQQNKLKLDRGKRKANLISQFGNKYGNLIFERKVEIGMTKEMCLEAWGYPLNKKSRITDEVNLTVWIYHRYNKLLFKNNKLITIEY